jgi:hypothetical protein
MQSGEAFNKVRFYHFEIKVLIPRCLIFMFKTNTIWFLHVSKWKLNRFIIAIILLNIFFYLLILYTEQNDNIFNTYAPKFVRLATPGL